MLFTPVHRDNSPNIKLDLYVTGSKQQIDTDRHHASCCQGIHVYITVASLAMHPG